MLDCCFEDEDSDQPLESFSELKKVIGEKQGDLGKVWMISGYFDSREIDCMAGILFLREYFTEEIDIAKVAYKNLMGKESQRIKIVKFMEADIFEFWQFPQGQSWRSILGKSEN